MQGYQFWSLRGTSKSHVTFQSTTYVGKWSQKYYSGSMRLMAASVIWLCWQVSMTQRWIWKIECMPKHYLISLFGQVKEWAKAHHINDSKSGTLNSYSLSLLVIFHFQVTFILKSSWVSMDWGTIQGFVVVVATNRNRTHQVTFINILKLIEARTSKIKKAEKKNYNGTSWFKTARFLRFVTCFRLLKK